MSYRYIRENKNSYAVVKNSKNYGKFDSLDDALFIRDELVKNDWDLNEINETYEFNGNYIVVKVIEDKVHILARYKSEPSQKTIDSLYKKRLRNPNNSRYGLNISRIFDTYVIKKRIFGDDYVFGYYDELADAEFVRNFLMDHDWNVNEFGQIEYDDETATFFALDVIDDRVYVLESSKEDIDIVEAQREFLNKISKHSLGLAKHDYLEELTNKLPELEKKYGIKTSDDSWTLKDTQNPLNDIIFSMTPFQQSVYDVVNHSTFDEIKQKLIRYRSKNFDEKIQRNLDELTESGLITKNGDHFEKRNI